MDPYLPVPPRPEERVSPLLGLVFLVLAGGSLLVGSQTCHMALPLCTGVIWVAFWAVGTLGLVGLSVVMGLRRQWRDLALTLLFLALAVARPVAELVALGT